MVDSPTKCSHVFIPTVEDATGEPVFEVNKMFGNTPVTHVKCINCNMRTWFNRDNWYGIQLVDE